MRVLFFILIAGITAAPLLADIQDARPSKSFKELNIASKAKKRKRSLQVAPVEVDVISGQAVMIPVGVMPEDIGNLAVRILIPPKHGKLEKTNPIPGSVACFLYHHDGNLVDSEDSFVFQAKAPLFGDSVRQTARIIIRKPQAEISVDPVGPIDFGKIPLGSRSVMDVRLSNVAGSALKGILSVSPPWRIEGDHQLRVSEGESRVIRLVFEPVKAGNDISRITLNPPMDSLPEITLTGGGVEPFIVSGARRLVVDKNHPVASLRLVNRLDIPLTVMITGIPQGISAPTQIELPPLGTTEWQLSVNAPLEGLDTERKYTMTFTAKMGDDTGSFHQATDLVILGPRAVPTIELLYGGGQSACKVGDTLRLEGIVRNPSLDEWIVDMRIGALNGASPSKSRLVIPSLGVTTFRYDWTPRVAGDDEVAVELREPTGRALVRKSWSVSAYMPITSASDSLSSCAPKAPAALGKTPNPIKGREIAGKLVVDLKPSLRKGWLHNQVALTWRYLGGDQPGFRIQMLQGRNLLKDRTGEQEENQWVDIQGVVAQLSNHGRWNADLPFLLPGIYRFRVFPASRGEVLVSTLTVEISPKTVYWPPLRALVLMMFALLAVREIRRRIH